MSEPTEPAPIVYVGTRAKRLRGRVPASLFRFLTNRTCSKCSAKCLIDHGSLLRAIDFGKRVNRRVQVVCDRCARTVEADLVGIAPMGDDLRAAVDRHFSATAAN